MPSFYGQGVTALKVKEGKRVFWQSQRDSDTGMPSNRVTRVHGDGGGMEHGQERPAGAKTLSILFRL